MRLAVRRGGRLLQPRDFTRLAFSTAEPQRRRGFFSVFQHGPRSRAELWGLCLGCSVFPLSVALINWYDRQKESPPELAPEFQSMQSVMMTPKQQLGGPFRLRDSRTGAYITDQELFQNHWTLLYFGFSKCAEVCPTTLQFITDVMRACDARLMDSTASEVKKLQAVFLSIDSFRDTPEVLEKYIAKYDPRLRALCGNAQEVRQAASAWRVYYSSVEETDEEREAREAKGIPEVYLDDTYQFDHSCAIYLVGPDGKMKDFFFKEMGLEDAVSRLEVHFADIYGFKDTR
ncbi:cytochrome c oxidase assembly factor [Trypanosoma rangeli]|uniref:Cytochrome c oxidase assembly factor n=1 Tax=Trypanosoma rangeli TaxID=5698 RepID=A0A3R7L4G0_TRYRA|nr:cytochrome c oxidase assembly factor [Trypanosoma rangeli]RNF07402.1 cytochrome c oxidase assembly factor [Trypanosoma rangeli]|eukprot:RNF07402.1 cytochrome c oxidase assembly factor [Trypanosoma rangeli]